MHAPIVLHFSPIKEVFLSQFQISLTSTGCCIFLLAMSKRKSVIAEEVDEEEADVQTDEGDIPYLHK